MAEKTYVVWNSYLYLFCETLYSDKVSANSYSAAVFVYCVRIPIDIRNTILP
jgi:hypothetical protein